MISTLSTSRRTGLRTEQNGRAIKNETGEGERRESKKEARNEGSGETRGRGKGIQLGDIEITSVFGMDNAQKRYFCSDFL